MHTAAAGMQWVLGKGQLLLLLVVLLGSPDTHSSQVRDLSIWSAVAVSGTGTQNCRL